MADLPSMPRGLILPPEVPDYRPRLVDQTMQQVVKSDAWTQYLEQNYLTKDELWGDDFTKYLEKTTRPSSRTR